MEQALIVAVIKRVSLELAVGVKPVRNVQNDKQTMLSQGRLR